MSLTHSPLTDFLLPLVPVAAGVALVVAVVFVGGR